MYLYIFFQSNTGAESKAFGSEIKTFEMFQNKYETQNFGNK